MNNIKPNSEWLDKKGIAIQVVSIDEENSMVTIKWPHNKKRADRTVSMQKFIEQVKPIDSKPEEAKEKSKPGQFTSAWIDELPSNFGKSPNLQLSNQDWLERGMHAKTVKFNIGAGGLPPEVNWEDHCAAIAMIDDGPAKALASILLWGSDTNWDWSRQFDEVVHHLAANMVGRCKKDGRSEPQACTHRLPELARLMARMVLYFELYELWDIYTVKGRLQFCGIKMKHTTYSQTWTKYQGYMLIDIENFINIIDCSVSNYRKEL